MHRILSLAALASLLFSLPAAAAPPKAAPKATPKAAAPAPAATEAAPAAGGGLNLKDASVSAFIGGEFGDLDGFTLRADGAIPLMPLTPKIQLLGVASLGFTHLGAETTYSTISWNMVKVTASARGQMAATPELDLFADAGLGFYFGGWSSEFTVPGIPGWTPDTTSKTDGTAGGFQMRFAVGGFYQVKPQIKLGAELGLNPYFGDADTTNFFIGVGASYKL